MYLPSGVVVCRARTLPFRLISKWYPMPIRHHRRILRVDPWLGRTEFLSVFLLLLYICWNCDCDRMFRCEFFDRVMRRIGRRRPPCVGRFGKCPLGRTMVGLLSDRFNVKNTGGCDEPSSSLTKSWCFCCCFRDRWFWFFNLRASEPTITESDAIMNITNVLIISSTSVLSFRQHASILPAFVEEYIFFQRRTLFNSCVRYPLPACQKLNPLVVLFTFAICSRDQVVIQCNAYSLMMVLVSSYPA